MKLANFRLRTERSGEERVGIVEGSLIFNTGRAETLGKLLTSGRGVWSPLSPKGSPYEIDDVVLSAPVRRPGKIIATIVNTRGMIGGDLQLDRPRLDMKAPSSVIGPGEKILSVPTGIRPEVELAAVLGRRISHASQTEAEEAIFGYTILNDVTAPRDSKDDAYEAYRRDPKTGEIRRTLLRGPLFRSKNHDTFCPTGPWIVTAQELGDPGRLRMSTRYGDLLVQDGTTAEYIFSPAEIVSYVSGFLSLEPGDIVSAGSVGWTAEALGDLDPTEFVLPGRPGVLSLEIEGIGRLENPVVVQGAGES